MSGLESIGSMSGVKIKSIWGVQGCQNEDSPLWASKAVKMEANLMENRASYNQHMTFNPGSCAPWKGYSEHVNDESVLRRLSFLYFVLFGFFEYLDGKINKSTRKEGVE